MQNDSDTSTHKGEEVSYKVHGKEGGGLYFAAMFVAALFFFVLLGMSALYVHDNPHQVALCAIASLVPAILLARELRSVLSKQNITTS